MSSKDLVDRLTLRVKTLYQLQDNTDYQTLILLFICEALVVIATILAGKEDD